MQPPGPALEQGEGPGPSEPAKGLSKTQAEPKTFGDRVRQFLRSSAVGIVATIGDMAVLELCMRVIGLGRVTSKIFSLAVGTSIQFFGSRYFAFRAQEGRIERQVRLFVVVEFCAYWITVLVFKGFVDVLHVPAEVANLLSGSVAYFGFSYPLWRWVFRVSPEERTKAKG